MGRSERQTMDALQAETELAKFLRFNMLNESIKAHVEDEGTEAVTL